MKRNDHPNAKRWLIPPTIEQIDAVVSASKASEQRFESFHGIYKGCIAQVRIGFRDMPLKYWHIFLAEDKQPQISKPISKTTFQAPQKTQRTKSDARLTTLI